MSWLTEYLVGRSLLMSISLFTNQSAETVKALMPKLFRVFCPCIPVIFRDTVCTQVASKSACHSHQRS